MKKLTCFLLFVATFANAQIARHRTATLMGSRFDLTVVAKDSLTAEAYIDTAIVEISRIENVISEWIPTTEVSLVNQNAGVKPVKVSGELFELTKRALWFSKVSDGAFDISFAAADRIWKFDGSMTELPAKKEIRKSVRLIGYENIVLDEQQSTIFLKKVGMKIGFGSIGKGYAADIAKELLVAKGVVAGIINASGDMNTWGTQPDGSAWTVGITDPVNTKAILLQIPMTKYTAVVTSGNYEKFAQLNGKRYSHIINPKTGYPASGLTSVTVFGDSAEAANGFSTAIMVLGKEKGLKLINEFPEFSCLLVTDEGEFLTSTNLTFIKL
ncbi:MAG: FAD:protein FMN transferase [Flavobacterium sp.]|uniref:FAD:protein FMN transferase n=1 Tax=Flavobacterium sp. TaxID=239 RepID=UPI0012141EA2|nr:FAD:protein FMN transferase [Flavobacterium sp.]RZJ67500.1 MAG: FAD:protein FMN transferase [Flavobacterium sp.]